MHILDHENAPPGVFSELEKAALTWVKLFITSPHTASQVEQKLRDELDRDNERERQASTRKLDDSPGIGQLGSRQRLVDHQIAELAMITGHMDGLGRALTILRLESEERSRRLFPGTLNPKHRRHKTATRCQRRIATYGLLQQPSGAFGVPIIRGCELEVPHPERTYGES